jgi:hypothetical protein
MAARVQALIGVAGETITYKRVTHGSFSTATLQSTPSLQGYAIKAGLRQYRAREITGLVQQSDREVRIAAADLSFTPRPNDQVVIGDKTYQVVLVNTRSPFKGLFARPLEMVHYTDPGVTYPSVKRQTPS